MKKIIDGIILELEKLTDKMIPKVQKIIDRKILSKFSDRGLSIAYWISSVLSKVFLLNLLIGGVLNLYVYGLNTYYGIVNDMTPYNWFSAIILNFILPTFLGLVSYILIRIITKLIKEKLTAEIDPKGVLFATGFFLIITHINGVIRNLTSICDLFYRLRWKPVIEIIDILNPLVNIIVPIIYILIGIRFIKMSNYLIDKKNVEKV